MILKTKYVHVLCRGGILHLYTFLYYTFIKDSLRSPNTNTTVVIKRSGGNTTTLSKL
ncbi:hypothetical protein Patl1_30268 [Pistacia atlantica]|uniref:Uncharacterized protein n=1 Tax=Pistacia atlantica TaxID=434234 RepID=A0ACC1AC90_9ROSI|nr:hypothetical protein Patl1_30268 [Pistacia atlantica]